MSFTKHNMSKTRLYRTWAGVKQRCLNPKDTAYEYYGGRGIKVCQEWIDSFETFKSWAELNGYSDSLTIDRKDVDGNYEPSNCRWITQKQQANNQRNNNLITYNRSTKTMAEWCECLNMDRRAIDGRLRRGWSIEKAFSVPIKPRNPHIVHYQGRDYTASALSRLLGIERQTLDKRLKLGWNEEELNMNVYLGNKEIRKNRRKHT